ncbi:MAG: pyrroline-5-carboxylate reductase [Candidatus Omnitrophica bacterium]|nr:pyrroline-5-carboxylate reductase [Candidatus Omnitrophota bacterium]
MRREKTVGIIGFGNMGSAISEGLLFKEWRVYVYDRNKRKLRGEKKYFVSPSTDHLIQHSPYIIIAVKPQDIPALLEEIKEGVLIHRPLIISIAAGVSIKFFEERLPKIKIIRVMPNLAAKKRESISFISPGRLVSLKDIEIAKEIFKCIGEAVLIKESFLDKVTAISGSGPGYVYYFMDTLYKSALSLGFSRIIAMRMVKKTFLGAITLIKDSREDFSLWIKKVASPGGTTQAALDFWKNCKLERLVRRGIKKAYLRARQLNLKKK